QVVAKAHAQCTQRLVDDLRLVGAEEHQIAILRAGALKNALDGIVGEELEDRRLQAVIAGGQVVDLDIGQALGAINADELGVVVDLAARQSVAVRHFQRGDTAFRVFRRTGEDLELYAVHQVGDINQLQR